MKTSYALTRFLLFLVVWRTLGYFVPSFIDRDKPDSFLCMGFLAIVISVQDVYGVYKKGKSDFVDNRTMSRRNT